ncbi:MAG: hypothetical protein AAFZ15_27870 [Bacteroidota bacterium]
MPTFFNNPIKKTREKVIAKTADLPFSKSASSNKYSASTITATFASICYGLVILLSVKHGNLFLKELVVAGSIILMVLANQSFGANK